MKKITLLIFSISVSSCVSQQLPDSSLVVLDNIQAGTLSSGYGSIIDSNGGLLARNLTSILGTICIPDEKGNCDVKSLLVRQCLAPNSKVEVVPDFNITPKDEFLINKNTKIEGKVLSTGVNIENDEYLDVKISVIAIARIANDELNGFPGKYVIKKCVSEQTEQPHISKVYWVNAANIIIKTTDRYKKVSSVGDITLTGIGVSGNTYNKIRQGKTDVLLGLDLREVVLPSSDGMNIYTTRSMNRYLSFNNKAKKTEYYELKIINRDVFNPESTPLLPLIQKE